MIIIVIQGEQSYDQRAPSLLGKCEQKRTSFCQSSWRRLLRGRNVESKTWKMSRNFPGDITEKETGVPDWGHVLGGICVSSTAWLEKKAYGEEPMKLSKEIQETFKGGGLWMDFHFTKSSMATVYRTHFMKLKF